MDDFGVYSKGFCTELFDGSSWSTQGALSTARTYLDGGGHKLKFYGRRWCTF